MALQILLITISMLKKKNPHVSSEMNIPETEKPPGA